MPDAPATVEELLKPRRSRLAATLRALIRARITAGILVVLPVWITWLLVKFIFSAMRDSSQWAVMGLLENTWFQEHVFRLAIAGKKFDVDQALRDNPWLDWGLAVFSVLLTVLILYAIGVFAANFFGRRIIQRVETLLDRVPLVKTVYRSSKQILTTFAGEEKQAFQRVAMFPVVAPTMYSLGFITSIFKDSRTGEECVTIFYATTPNPTTGFVLILRRADVIELDWTVEQAVKAIMSGGILMPAGIQLALPRGGLTPVIPGAVLVPPGAAPATATRPAP
jgi:uncharacterized membrane protein